jgi:hypothetical protein
MLAHDSVHEVDGTTKTTLQRLAATGPLSAQNLNLISLETIRASFGPKWPAKRDIIWNQVERFLRHQFRGDDLVMRLDEVTALVAQPSCSKFAAQTRCAQVAQDLIQFFLGAEAAGGVGVQTVEEVNDEGVIGRPLPTPQLRAALMGRDPSVWAREATEPLPRWVRQGRDLEVVAQLAPLLALHAAKADVGYSVETQAIDKSTGRALTQGERFTLLSSDMTGLDLKVLRAAFEKRQQLPQSAAPMVAPVSQTTLTNSTLRYALFNAVSQLTPLERQSFIWEVVDLEPGAPQGRLVDLVAMARPMCRGVICNTTLTRANAEKLKQAGATLSVSLPPNVTEASLLALGPALSTTLRMIPAVMVHGVPARLLPVAAFVGVTHCTATPATAPAAGSGNVELTTGREDSLNI